MEAHTTSSFFCGMGEACVFLYLDKLDVVSVQKCWQNLVFFSHKPKNNMQTDPSSWATFLHTHNYFIKQNIAFWNHRGKKTPEQVDLTIVLERLCISILVIKPMYKHKYAISNYPCDHLISRTVCCISIFMFSKPCIQDQWVMLS